MRIAAVLLVVVLVGFAGADELDQLGYREDTNLIPSQQDDCMQGEPFGNHDGSAENGYAWSGSGTQPPYYGAFGEAFALGPGGIYCGTYWFTQVGLFQGHPMDCYVWDGGVSTEPGGVLFLLPGIVPENIPYWPDCGQNDIVINCHVSGEFTIGYWADFSNESPEWYVCADENGYGGYPWTCIAPGIGYPTGWQHLRVVFESCVSLLIGGYFTPGPSPAESRTWGSVKALFGE